MSDYRTTTGEPRPPTQRDRRRRRWRLLLATILILAALAAAGLLIRVDRYVLCSGYITTQEYAEVRPAAVGRVAEIRVHSGAHVEEGDLLVQLDASEEAAVLEEARSRIRQGNAELARRQAEVAERKRALQQEIAIAELRLRNAQAKRARTEELLARGLVAASALEDETLKEELAAAESGSLKSRDTSVYEKELAVLEQELEARQDVAARAEARLAARQIRAPIAGDVLRYEFVPGELVRPESVLYEIFGGEKQVLKLRVGERYATRVRTGQRYLAWLAPYRGLQKIRFQGRIQRLRDVIQAEGQQTYRVAYCSFDPQGLSVPPGTSAEARIYHGRTCLWLYLFGLD